MSFLVDIKKSLMNKFKHRSENSVRAVPLRIIGDGIVFNKQWQGHEI